MSSLIKCLMIVSVSRRCDIPRFQFDWFMERLDAGYVDVANPFNAGQVRRVPLEKDAVDAFVFWTRDPRHILANAEKLEKRGFPFYVMVTVVDYPSALEPNKVPLNFVLDAIKELSRKIGVERVIWRYDPVILTSVTNNDFHLENFGAIARELAGSVRRVIVSFYDEYRGAKQRLEKLEKAGELQMLDSGFEDILSGFAKSAGSAGMEIQSCAEKEDFSPFGIKRGACIDAELIKKLSGKEFAGKDKNQRPYCLCCKSVDIGSYGKCAAKCAYCYAW